MPTGTNKKSAPKPTLRTLNRELSMLRGRVADLEDLRDLHAAIARNGNKAGIPWQNARAALGLSPKK